MEDMVDLKPFQAANKTSIFMLKRGESTTYSLPVIEWKRKKGVGRVQSDWSIQEVLEKTERANLEAIPVDPGKKTSSWQTAGKAELKESALLKGTNPYRAYQGADTQPYGVFHLRIKEVRPDGKLVIENLHDRGKLKVKRVGNAIESNLVYPAVSGREIIKFGFKGYFYVLISQNPETRKPYDEDWMIETVPLAYAYLTQFKDVLDSRKSQVIRDLIRNFGFYAMYGVGDYTFAKYRVTWKFMASSVKAAVLSQIKTPFGVKELISTKTTALFPVAGKREAHYLCAILNSDIVDSFIRSFSSAGRGFGAPSVMENLAIPKFDSENRLHNRLTELSLEAHDLVARGHDISEQEAEINEAAKKLWNIKS